MTEHRAHAQGGNGHDNRNHFIVDINSVFRLFGKRYFLIFYFGRDLNPRQVQRLVNQRTATNWLVILIFLGLLAGAVYGMVQLIGWRLAQPPQVPTGASTELQINFHALSL